MILLTEEMPNNHLGHITTVVNNEIFNNINWWPPYFFHQQLGEEKFCQNVPCLWAQLLTVWSLPTACVASQIMGAEPEPLTARSAELNWIVRGAQGFQGIEEDGSQKLRPNPPFGGFLKWWYPTTRVFLRKRIILGCFAGTTILGNPRFKPLQFNFHPFFRGKCGFEYNFWWRIVRNTLGIQSPSENGDRTWILCWGDLTPQSLSDNMAGCLGRREMVEDCLGVCWWGMFRMDGIPNWRKLEWTCRREWRSMSRGPWAANLHTTKKKEKRVLGYTKTLLQRSTHSIHVWCIHLLIYRKHQPFVHR